MTSCRRPPDGRVDSRGGGFARRSRDPKSTCRASSHLRDLCALPLGRRVVMQAFISKRCGRLPARGVIDRGRKKDGPKEGAEESSRIATDGVDDDGTPRVDHRRRPVALCWRSSLCGPLLAGGPSDARLPRSTEQGIARWERRHRARCSEEPADPRGDLPAPSCRRAPAGDHVIHEASGSGERRDRQLARTKARMAT